MLRELDHEGRGLAFAHHHGWPADAAYAPSVGQYDTTPGQGADDGPTTGVTANGTLPVLEAVAVTPVVLVAGAGYLMLAHDTRRRLGLLVTIGMVVTDPIGVVLLQDHDPTVHTREALGVKAATVDGDLLKNDGLAALRARDCGLCAGGRSQYGDDGE